MLYLITSIVIVVAVVAWDLRRSSRLKRALASGHASPGDTRSLGDADATARAALEKAKGTAMGNDQDGGYNNAGTGPHRG